MFVLDFSMKTLIGELSSGKISLRNIIIIGVFWCISIRRSGILNRGGMKSNEKQSDSNNNT